MSLYPAAIEAALSGIPRSSNSKIFFVDPANGSDTNIGDRWTKPLLTIAAAYALCTADHNDCVVLAASGTSNTLSVALTWAKDQTHLVGLAAPTQTLPRSKVIQLSSLTGASPLVTISASGCMFRDVQFFQGVADATSLVNVSVTGASNYFENVHFAGGAHVTQAVAGGASLLLAGGTTNTFYRCTIGVDTVTAATGMDGIQFSLSAARNLFRECTVRLSASNAGAAFVEVILLTGIASDNIFDNCIFMNNSATALTSGAVIPVSVAATAHIVLRRCTSFGATKWDANDRGTLVGDMNAVTASDTGGLAVVMYA